MTIVLRLCGLTLLLFISACQNNSLASNGSELTLGAEQKKLLDKSWSEYIIKVKANSPNWQSELQDKLPVIKIKSFAKQQYVFTLNKPMKYKTVYHLVGQVKSVISLQPNFQYKIPRPVKSISIQ